MHLKREVVANTRGGIAQHRKFPQGTYAFNISILMGLKGNTRRQIVRTGPPETSESSVNCDKDATGAGRIVRWRVHFLTPVWRECSISAAVLAGRVPPVGQAF